MKITYRAILYLDNHEYKVADLEGKSKETFCREHGIEPEMVKVYITREEADAAKVSESCHGGFLTSGDEVSIR
jgi:hypothetical protein